MFTQQDFDMMPKYETFRYWFIRTTKLNTFEVFKKLDSGAFELVGEFQTDSNDSFLLIESDANDIDSSELNANWVEYMARPEYFVGCKSISNDLDYMINFYEKYLVGVAFIRIGRTFKWNPDHAWSKINECLEWLRTTDFYSAPASRQYHDSEVGGLCKHTLNVVNRMLDLIVTAPFSTTTRIEDAALVSLVHDWCKIGLYESYMKNVKNPDTQKWEQVSAFKYRENRYINLGHGVSSMFLAQKFFKLSIEEASAIRWHQGRWNVCREEMNEIQQSNEMFPLVHLIQFADQLAIVKY